ncbi:hypothetical protein J3A83DRAFT_4196578 [Scleroderma citrinum]
MAMYMEFGDPDCHAPHTAVVTLTQLNSIQFIAIQALMEFQYLAQALAITSVMCNHISTALGTLHEYKDAIINAGLHCGQSTGNALDHGEIPNLEFMQSVVPSVQQSGAVIQWSADTIKHAHIKVVKDLVTTTNNQLQQSDLLHP